MFAAWSLEPAYGFLFDLSHTLAGEVEFRSDLFKCHFLTAYSEEHLEYFTFALMELAERTLYLA